MRLFLFLIASLLCAMPMSGQSAAGAAKPAKLHESGFVNIGGIEQWIDIRGNDPANPLLLILHGGPGARWDPLVKLFEPWEAHFIMVEWDQRGAGRTYAKNGPDSASITIDRVVSDGIEVAEYVKKRFGGRRLILLGHSWGSLIGVHMIAARPDLFCAYVGTGQEVNPKKAEALDYAEIFRRARHAENGEAVRSLVAVGAPPYDDAEKLGVMQRWESEFAPQSEQKFNSIDYVRSLSPLDFTEKDMDDRMKGSRASYEAVYGDKLEGPMLSVDLFSAPAAFRIPVFFIQGELDDVTPTSLVREYVRHVRAPQKSLTVLPGDGHLAVFADPNRFLDEMRRVLGPTGCCNRSSKNPH